MSHTEKHPLISIITITFNAEKEIEPTMKSVGEQTFRDFEHLIIDGASKDLTLSQAQKYAGKNTIIVSEPDKGLYDAMNKGLKKATGKYIIFLNAGDAFASPDILEKYAQEALKDKDIIYGDTLIVNSNREIIAPRHLSVPLNLDFKSFSKGMLICHQAFMVKKSLCEPYDLNYRFSADYDWCIKCIKKSKPADCTNLKQVTIHYLSDGLTDKNKIKSLRERFRIMSNYYGFLPTFLNHFSFIFRSLKRHLN